MISREKRTTQPLKFYIKIAEILLLILIDKRASVYAIFRNLAKKLGLKIKANNGIIRRRIKSQSNRTYL